MNSKSPPIQKVMDIAKRRKFDPLKQEYAQKEYAKLKEATNFVKTNDNEQVNC